MPTGLGPATGDPGEANPPPPPPSPTPPAPGGVRSADGLTPAAGGPAASAGLTTGKDADGRLEVFAVDLQGGLIHSWQLAPNGTWSAWQWMGVFVQGRPSVGLAPDGRMELFATDPAGGIIHTWQLHPNGVWSAWQWMGAFADDPPSIGTAPDGRLELFAPDPSGGLIHAWQLTPNGVWSGWHGMGTAVAGSPSIAAAPDGRLEAFAVMPDDLVIHAWQLTPNGVWSTWAQMNATGRSAPSVARQADGRLVVFTADRSGSLHAAVQAEPNGVFQDWAWTGTSAVAAPAVGVSSDGRLELFAVDPDGGLIHRWQLTTDGSSWSDWFWMGILTREAPAVATSPDRRLELFARDPAGGVVHSWQLAPDGTWSSWAWMGVFARGLPRIDGYDVGTTVLELGTADRPLHTTVYFPAVRAGGGYDAALPGPFPLLVFAHGFNVSAARYADLLADLASRGYVVAAPEFARSSTYYPGPRESDPVAQAADISHLIDRFAGGGPADIDLSRIGVVGHSDGGITAAGIGFNTAARDPRVQAVAVLTGAATDFSGDWFPTVGAPAALFVHGSADAVNAYYQSTSMLARAHAPKYLLRIEGGTHLAPFTQRPFEPLVSAVVADFFDLRLAGRPNAQARLDGDGAEAGLTLTAG